MSDPDEFDAYDFSEFSEKDLAEIDARIAREHSPYNKFLAWKNHFAVTDLVSPIWCEVQHEYSLHGNRNRPIQERPSTFTAKSGKQIHVTQHIAQLNDRRLKRGKSAHKALENQLRPIKVIVHWTSYEERFALRLVELVDGFTQLVTDGITRELPVFSVIHDEIVIGVIDEVLLSPITHAALASSSPASSPHKKQRLLPSHTLQCIPDEPYELRLVDYKTRRAPHVPVMQDSLSPRLQLMMYHRMLSSLLHPEAFDFDLLWKRLNLDPTKPFSPQFLKDINWNKRLVDLTNPNVNLNRVISLWIATVHRQRPRCQGVSQQLQLVYRRSTVAATYQPPEPADIEDPLEALVLQDQINLARAIEESLHDMGHQHLGQVAHHVAQNVMQVGFSSVGRTSVVWKDLVSLSDSDQLSDPTLAWAIQQSLLTCAHNARTEVKQIDHPASDVQPQDEPTVEITPIIGTREFNMDDDELDTHITDVLQWWLGTRPARGVDVGQTNRCFTCEYQESCEWRECKAKEALARASERRGNAATPLSA